MSSIAAVILAGGVARRLGGGDKSLRLVGGRTILNRTIAVLAPYAAVAISANGNPARFAAYGLSILPDQPIDTAAGPDLGSAGPLAGVLAALEWAAACGATRLISVPGDCPFLPSDLAPRLLATADSIIAFAASGGRSHPVTAIWPTSIRNHLRAALSRGERRAGVFAKAHDAISIEWTASPFDRFLNVNTPADLENANRSACLLAETLAPPAR